MDAFQATPGRLYVVGTLLPLAAFAFLLVAGGVRALCRPFRQQGGTAASLYWALGGDVPARGGAIFATRFMALSAACGVAGLVLFLTDTTTGAEHAARWAERTDWLRLGPLDSAPPPVWEKQSAADESRPTPPTALALELGYKIDHLTAVVFAMVTVISTLIFVFSLGYMKDETKESVEDHAIEVKPGSGDGHGHTSDPSHTHTHSHLHRRGRYGRFFLYLSLFCFSMLNLVIADNLFQVFVSWELVGVCSFFLIGFYYERPSAARAANKAFIVNRVGDAGFLIGIAVAFAAFGTLNIADLNAKFEHGHPSELTHTLWIALGLGIFLGAVGKSAQVPLQTWLPDAMEGPTPVSALIHAATMVAAGVYLVGRCYPIFSPEVLLVIAYVGLITLFVSATTALVMTDIKRVLAYSTCSQLGYMMLALGVGGWTAGLLHLLTHAFFKALLFLCAGSVIHGLHHEQDLRRMGGLRRKMPITAYTMLVGVLAISGAPLFSGWYSKDIILSSALGFSLANTTHFLLFFGPLLTAGLTAFYMFRLWFLAFGGEPRDKHLYDHAHESPAVMTLPLLVLAIFSVGVAWGWPVWDAEASALGKLLHAGEPHAHLLNGEQAHKLSEQYHLWAGGLALLAAVCGVGYAWTRYGKQAPAPDQLAEPKGVFANRWYFDDVYDAVFTRRTVDAAHLSANLDRANPDRQGGGSLTLDGLLNSVADLAAWGGQRMRLLQTGRIRGYVLVLALTVVGLLGMLFALVR
jgi:NADH-quinone oxidoreductase subunit L